MKKRFLLALSIYLLASCSAVKTPVTNQYQLSEACIKPCMHCPHQYTLMISPPEAYAAYQTEQMLYIECPYQLDAFVHNAWVSPPASMLHSLLIKTLHTSGFFCAVTSGTYSESTDFRLDTQLLNLHQNFLKKPSEIEFSAKVVLTSVKDNHIIASRLINECIPCSSDTPLGGVMAANKAVQLFTAEVDDFVISHIH